MKLDKYECEGQISLFEIADKPVKFHEAEWLRAHGFKNVYEEPPKAGIYEFTDIEYPTKVKKFEVSESGAIILGGSDFVARWWRPVTDKAAVSICKHSKHTCNKQNLWEVADTLDALQCPHVCCRKCNTRGCGARCNGSEEPEPKKAFEAGDHVEEHGARVMFEELQVNHYYIADYSTESHKWFKVVFVKWIKDDAVGFVDSPKGIKGKWSWGTKYSALSRKMYINAERNSAIGEADTSGWFYELPGPKITDDYIQEHPTCFYVYGYYLDREDGWHKMPEELPTFKTWTVVDVVVFGKKTGTSWMELEKWEAKDWTFRSIEDRGNTESIEILAWKIGGEQQ